MRACAMVDWRRATVLEIGKSCKRKTRDKLLTYKVGEGEKNLGEPKDNRREMNGAGTRKEAGFRKTVGSG